MCMYVVYMNICVWMQARRLVYLKGPAIAVCLILLRQSLIKSYTGFAAKKTPHHQLPHLHNARIMGTHGNVSLLYGLWDLNLGPCVFTVSILSHRATSVALE